MAMELPPSRYRVIERGRRLEVIDTLAGRRPAYAAEARPQPWAEPVAEFSNTSVEVPAPRPTAPVGSMPEPPPDFLVSAASLVGRARDGDGRLLLVTARWYDSKAPRTIALDQAAERKLGAAVLVLLALATGGVIVGVLVGWAGFAVLFIAMSLGGRVKGIATPWFDRVAASER